LDTPSYNKMIDTDRASSKQGIWESHSSFFCQRAWKDATWDLRCGWEYNIKIYFKETDFSDL